MGVAPDAQAHIPTFRQEAEKRAEKKRLQFAAYSTVAQQARLMSMKEIRAISAAVEAAERESEVCTALALSSRSKH